MSDDGAARHGEGVQRCAEGDGGEEGPVSDLRREDQREGLQEESESRGLRELLGGGNLLNGLLRLGLLLLYARGIVRVQSTERKSFTCSFEAILSSQGVYRMAS